MLKAKSERGNFGLIILLISLLIVGYLLYQNLKSQSMEVGVPTVTDGMLQDAHDVSAQKPEQVMQKFQGDLNNINQKIQPPPLDPPAE